MRIPIHCPFDNAIRIGFLVGTRRKFEDVKLEATILGSKRVLSVLVGR
jgi:hypothetical protein